MPLYEYYCEPLRRHLRADPAGQPVLGPAAPAPSGDGDGERLMPTQVHAFTMRGGMPRRIPDKGLYWTTKGQSTKPMTSSDLSKIEPFLVKEDKVRSASTVMTPEEIEAAPPPPLEVRERVRGSKSRGRRLAESSESTSG